MRIVRVILAGIVCAAGVSGSAQSKSSPSDQWFLNHDLVPIPVTRQTDAIPGSLIAFLPNGSKQYIHPDDVVTAKDVSMTVGSSDTAQAIKVGILAKLVGQSIAGSFTKNKSMVFTQTEFKGLGYNDTVRENTILQPNTSVTKSWEDFQKSWAKVRGDVPVYFIQAVYTTADLEVSSTSNTGIQGSVGSDSQDACKDVTVPSVDSGSGSSDADAAKKKTNTSTSSQGTGTSNDSSASKTSKPKTSSSKPSTSKSGSGGGTVDATPGGGVQLCSGRGGKDVLKANHQVPVAMSVCYVYWWENDKSYNCKPAKKGLTF